MNNGTKLKAIDWRKTLGLLPVPLRATSEKQHQFVLMNGTTGNFCLDYNGSVDVNSRRAIAWSCDVGHYLTCTEETVIVNHWGREAKEEVFTLASVVEKLHEFHRHLDKTSPNRSRSIAAHVLRVFRQIRSVVDDGEGGGSALRILIHMIASCGAEEVRLEDDLERWGLDSNSVQLSKSITDATWESLCADLLGKGRYDVFRPDFHLLLRHASGAVFQEAHLAATLSPNLWIPGLEQPVIIESSAKPAETGVYFTPPALARTLAEEVTRLVGTTTSIKIFDPACGSGELLKECLRLLKLNNFSGDIRVIGWDKSAAAIDVARFVLAWERRAWLEGQIDIEITQCDSLSELKWPKDIDILVMNPPFKSWQLMSETEQEAVSNIVGSVKKPNLAMAFVWRSLDALRDKGVLGAIIPNSILEGESGKDTRRAIGEVMWPKLVARLGDQSIFARALVDVGMYVGVKGHTDGSTSVLWADSRQSALNHALRGLRQWRGSEAVPMTHELFSIYQSNCIATSSAPWIVRSYDSWRLSRFAETNAKMIRANDVFEIHQGVRLGSDVFVVPKTYWQGLGKKERTFFRPAVMNPSINNGVLNDSYFAFYPNTVGLPQLTTEDDLKRHLPNYYKDFLEPAKSHLIARKGVAPNTGLGWWDLIRPGTWQMEPCVKLVSKYFGRHGCFAVDRAGHFVVVVGLAWKLKPSFSMAFPESIDSYAITDDEFYLATLAYLNTDTAFSLLRYNSVQVSGGQLNLSKMYTKDVRILNLAQLQPEDTNLLVEVGSEISEGDSRRVGEIDELVRLILAESADGC